MHCWLEVVSGCGDEVVSEANRTSADMEFVGFRSWIELRGIVDNLATGADRKSEEEGSEAKDEEEFLEAWKIVRSCNVIRNTPYTQILPIDSSQVSLIEIFRDCRSAYALLKARGIVMISEADRIF